MTRHRKDTLRTLTEEERTVLESVARARSEPASHVARAKILLAVADGATYQGAAYAAGRQSNDAVAQLVARFNAEGLAATAPRHGRGAHSGLGSDATRAYSAGGPSRSGTRTKRHSDLVVEQLVACAADGMPGVCVKSA